MIDMPKKPMMEMHGKMNVDKGLRDVLGAHMDKKEKVRKVMEKHGMADRKMPFMRTRAAY